MRDKVTRQCPQTTTSVEKGEPSEEKGEPKRPIRTEAPPAEYQPNALPLDQTGSHGIVEMYLSKNAFIAMKQCKNGLKIGREVDECHTRQVHSVHTWPVLEYRERRIPSIGHAASVTN